MTTSSDKRVLHIDLETYCETDLAKCGVHRYAADPSLRILLISCALDDLPVVTIDPTQTNYRPMLDEFRRLMADPNIIKAAHNAQFEMTILRRKGYRVEPEEWIDTMALANIAGLPPSLASLTTVLGLGEKGKMSIGKQLIAWFCKPDKKGNRRLPENDLARWEAFVGYNVRDVEAEREVYKKLIKYDQGERERAIHLLDYRINDRGINVDVTLARQAVKISEQITSAAKAELKKLTGVENPASVIQFKNWLADRGIEVDSLTKDVAEEIRDTTEDPLVKRAVGLKLSISKASVKKYDAMLRAAGDDPYDARVRGAFQYYGANRTGRWAGRLVQLQNLRRNALTNLDIARQLVRNGDLEGLELAYDDYEVSEILGQLVRTAFIPSPGNKFIVSDFSAIEARVVAWLARERWRQNVFARDGDIYKSSYSQAFGVPVDEVTKPMRQKGKIMELALGYGGSVGALKAFGADRLGLNDEELRGLVERWRAASPKIVRLWRELESACRAAIDEGRRIQVSYFSVWLSSGALRIKLPSGRSLYYQRPEIREGKYGPAITYMGVDQTSRKWTRIETHGGKLVENVTQAVARDCLAEAMLWLNWAGYSIVSHIHDEVIIDAPAEAKVSDVEAIMSQPINWAQGLKLTAKGYEGSYYFKD